MDNTGEQIMTDIDVRVHMAENDWAGWEIEAFIAWAGNRDRSENQWEEDIQAFAKFIADNN